MPLYEYKCAKCGHRFEKIEKVTAPDIQKCPKCGAKAERMASAAAIQFKGTGWYVTDYGKKPSSSGTSENSGDGGPKSDSKPAAESKPASEKNSAPASKDAAKKKK